ncbi:MAG: FAD-dependent oxidoreductase [Clostridia bacterium]|nr:FAD-dependent oxidoreductase [Clostridia bacterium]
MKSIWSDFSMPRFPKLCGDIKTDVLIVGGGIAGLLIAHELTARGVECVVAEAKNICGGITKNTTAKITSQHGLIYDKLIKSGGADAAKLYFDANEGAIAKYRVLSKEIECDFEEQDAYVFMRDGLREIGSELKALDFIGSGAEFTNKTSLPFPVAGAIRFKGQAQFHPLKFAEGIAKGLNIYENTEVYEIEGTVAITSGGKITAGSIVIATHFPFINSRGLYFLKMYQERSYVTAFDGGKVDGMYVDGSKSGLSFRNFDDFLLIGGGSCRTGKKSPAWSEAKSIAERHFPKAKAVYKWANQDCVTLDGIPYIGRYSKNTPRMYVATGFNKWGMTSAMVAAEIIADMICEKENEYASLFSPSRSMFTKQLAINAFETTANLLRFSTPRCPHLGCALKWNKAEKTWDCPCHGSRFRSDGKLIDNPAAKDIKKS